MWNDLINENIGEEHYWKKKDFVLLSNKFNYVYCLIEVKAY